VNQSHSFQALKMTYYDVLRNFNSSKGYKSLWHIITVALQQSLYWPGSDLHDFVCCPAAGPPAPAVLLLLALLSAMLTLHKVAARYVSFESASYLDSPRMRPNITCELLIEGGSNATEMSLYGISIARAHINCTGGVLIVTFHPVLARFASGFTGVALGLSEPTAKPTVQAMGRSARVEGIPIKYGECIPAPRVLAQLLPPSLLTLCESEQDVVFQRARVVNISVSKCDSCERAILASNSPVAQADVVSYENGVWLQMMPAIRFNITRQVHFHKPEFIGLSINAWQPMGLARVTAFEGVFDRTGGML
jgi:hypothetical protein